MKPTKSRYFIERFLQKALGDAAAASANKCINIGCGPNGRYAAWLSPFDVDGVDVEAQQGPQPWRYHQADAAALPFPDSYFDLAVAVESFEHIENNTAAMADAFRVLKPGATFIATVPTHYTWPFEFGGHGPHYYTRQSIRALFEGAGFRVRFVRPSGGLLYYLTNLGKNWVSPIGRRLFGTKTWWPLIDGICWPFYAAAQWLDIFLPILPSNWLILAEKP